MDVPGGWAKGTEHAAGDTAADRTGYLSPASETLPQRTGARISSGMAASAKPVSPADLEGEAEPEAPDAERAARAVQKAELETPGADRAARAVQQAWRQRMYGTPASLIQREWRRWADGSATGTYAAGDEEHNRNRLTHAAYDCARTLAAECVAPREPSRGKRPTYDG